MENHSATKEQNDTFNTMDESRKQIMLSGRSHTQKALRKWQKYGKAKLWQQKSVVARGWSKKRIDLKGHTDIWG